MPVHDWARVDAKVFHHFHQRWTIATCDALNAGLLNVRTSGREIDIRDYTAWSQGVWSPDAAAPRPKRRNAV